MGAYASPLVNWGALESRYPNYPDIDSLTVSADEREGLLDLRPYMERGPHVIYNIASAMRAYRMFRTLGLRHLLVIDGKNHVVGIITRSELLASHMKACEVKSALEGLTSNRSNSSRSPDSPGSIGEMGGITLDALHNDDVY